ncbi:hypothetical protein RHGRI_022873 [Rhododendron griersonianum]|uniref:Uncharacterized protein n=1 Tax=Rhododendron griersonianum TaxID=479676 RepID=A0AAV6J561_9ERIC|nr:hypothetical protein RHGRI_022873 [Rhododendron griersonianum]
MHCFSPHWKKIGRIATLEFFLQFHISAMSLICNVYVSGNCASRTRASREFYLNTEEFIDAVAQELISKLQTPAVV